MGAEVSISKNRLREDAVNFVFGAHLGFPAEWTRRHACIFVNLEQLGQAAQVSADLPEPAAPQRGCDYDADNLTAYLDPRRRPGRHPAGAFAHAPYLRGDASPALEDRPIDLLFFGSMNPRRRAFLDKIEAGRLQRGELRQPCLRCRAR
jgi:hypothetical protein